jgi:hypothetical protein
MGVKRECSHGGPCGGMEATLNGCRVTVYVSLDGTIWYYDDGQCSIASSLEAPQWLREHAEDSPQRERWLYLLEHSPGYLYHRRKRVAKKSSLRTEPNVPLRQRHDTLTQKLLKESIHGYRKYTLGEHSREFHVELGIIDDDGEYDDSEDG